MDINGKVVIGNHNNNNVWLTILTDIMKNIQCKEMNVSNEMNKLEMKKLK